MQMPEMPEARIPDLTRFSEVLRRRLYDQVAESQFDQPDAGPTPDQAMLQVFYIAGRWFAGWVDPDAPPGAPDHLRLRLVRIGWQEAVPGAIELYEV